MDFVSESIARGRSFRTLNIIDEFTREALAIEVDTSLPARRVIKTLERVGTVQGIPEYILCDDSSEFISRLFDRWSYSKRIKLLFITPGKHTENCYGESFNGKFINMNWF